MKIAKRIFLIIISLGIISFFSASQAFAVDCTNNAQTDYSIANANGCPPVLSQIAGVIVVVIQIMLAISVVVFFFMLVVNGFNFITAGGSSEKIDSARKSIVFSVIGFALVFGSFLIITIIANFTGIDKGRFSVDNQGNIHFNILAPPSTTPGS